jgi:putative redox protein
MTIELQRLAGAPLAQSLRIGAHQMLTDVTEKEGGSDTGPSPHDFYDAALASCKALTVMWYARKKGIPVEDVHTVVEHDDSQERAGIYKLSARMRISGPVTDEQLAELANVAQKCPVHKLMTTVATEITTQVERMA